MSRIREGDWQEMSQGNARYNWSIVRKLRQQGVTNVPQPYVPNKHNVTISELKRAENTFEEALDYCEKRPSKEWKDKYGVTNADAAIARLRRALQTIRREKQRLQKDKKHRTQKRPTDRFDDGNGEDKSLQKTVVR